MNKLVFILIIALVSCNFDKEQEMFQRFQKFITKYNKKYNSMNEFLARFEVFKRNAMSAIYENEPYIKGITQFSDLTQQEFKKMYLNFNYNAFAFSNVNPYHAIVSNAAPDAFDWRDKGAVGPVGDQEAYTSSTVFVTLDNLQSLYYLKKGNFVTLSQQMIIDCCVYGTQIIDLIFDWIKQHGIESDSDYPYVGKKGECKENPSKYIDMIVTGYKKLNYPADEEEMKEFLYETSPLIVGLNGTPLQTYSGGIIDKTSSECPSSELNHVGILVGYGHDDASGKDYWIVKNSWGEKWGENGYFRIKRGSGTCGINTYVMTGTVSF